MTDTIVATLTPLARPEARSSQSLTTILTRCEEWIHYLLLIEMCPQMPIVVTHTMNVFGERQNPEKFIPGVLSAVMNGEQVRLKNKCQGIEKCLEQKAMIRSYLAQLKCHNTVVITA